jgi:hypothetical protein
MANSMKINNFFHSKIQFNKMSLNLERVKI